MASARPIVAHCCAFNLKGPDTKRPMSKPCQFLVDSRALAEGLDGPCTKDHEHGIAKGLIKSGMRKSRRAETGSNKLLEHLLLRAVEETHSREVVYKMSVLAAKEAELLDLENESRA